MCDINCLRWASRHLSVADVQGKRICEVGSYDVNGSLRYLIEPLQPAEYVGVDMAPGPGVDRVCAADSLVQTFGPESFDVVVSTCMLEHVREWKPALSNMKGICKRGGLLLIAVPSRWPYHPYPEDYWRYRADDMRSILADCTIEALDEDTTQLANSYARARKPSEFVAKDLSDFALYSIILGRRVRSISDNDLQGGRFRWLSFKSRVWTGAWALINRMLARLL